MNRKDCGFLLLTAKLGDPNRKPLTASQLNLITQRFQNLPQENTELTEKHLRALGLEHSLVQRILSLLDDELQLKAYLAKAQKAGCIPITRASENYPLILRKRLGKDAPGCIWVKGNPELLRFRAVSLVGSRDLLPSNRDFACEAGIQAAKQHFVLVSGNARGADLAAQNACQHAGGYVVSVVADSLLEHNPSDHILYLCEDNFDEPFSALRALRRNCLIHAFGEMTFVAQSSFGKGGTWDGSLRNLRNQWSPLFCFQDNRESTLELEHMGAALISREALSDFSKLSGNVLHFFKLV